jgi:hypothetical protein
MRGAVSPTTSGPFGLTPGNFRRGISEQADRAMAIMGKSAHAKKLTEFKVLTFDVVGTLIDFEAGIASYVASVASRTGVSVEKEAVLAAYRKARASAQALEYHADNPDLIIESFRLGTDRDVTDPDLRELLDAIYG